MNDYEAHLGSYDHSHKQRLKDMKAMVRDPNAGARARKAEARADGLISIKVPEGGTAAGTSAGFKKGGFKKSGFKSTMAPVEQQQQQQQQQQQSVPKPAVATVQPEAVGLAKPPLSMLDESDTEDEGYEMYDPRYPTD